MTAYLIPAGIVLVTVVLTELFAAWFHKRIMHGPGWGWHASHHAPEGHRVERNDLYAVVFAVFTTGLFWAGTSLVPALWWVATGLCVYGVIYFFVHDGLVHQRWPFRYIPRRGYLRRIYQAHRLHHAVHERDGAVSFGFVLVEPVATLTAKLRANGTAQTQPHRGASDAP